MREAPDAASNLNEREILYKVLFDMRQEMQDLKKLVYALMQSDASHVSPELAQRVFNQPPPS